MVLAATRIAGGSGDGHLTVRGVTSAMNLSFISPPTAVRATSSDGSVLVDVPHDLTVYRVDVSTKDGSRTVDVPTDPSSDRHIAVSTQDGSVRVETLR